MGSVKAMRSDLYNFYNFCSNGIEENVIPVPATRYPLPATRYPLLRAQALRAQALRAQALRAQAPQAQASRAQAPQAQAPQESRTTVEYRHSCGSRNLGQSTFWIPVYTGMTKCVLLALDSRLHGNDQKECETYESLTPLLSGFPFTRE